MLISETFFKEKKGGDKTKQKKNTRYNVLQCSFKVYYFYLQLF